MIREDAIIYLRSRGFSEGQIATVQQALKQGLCEDVISRRAVLDSIAEWVVSGCADSEADCYHISRLVMLLPPAIPK